MAGLFAVVAVGRAQAQRYLVHTYDEAAGLSSADVRAIVQATDGGMWFGTRGGATYYDGVDWHNYARVEGLPQFDLACLALGADGRVWGATREPDARVVCFVEGRWVPIVEIEGIPKDGELPALAVVGWGDETTLVVATSAGEVHAWCDGRWRALGWQEDLGHAPIGAIVPHAGQLFIATTRGIFAVDPEALIRGESGRPERVLAVPEREVKAVAAGVGEDVLWIVGDGWLGRLEAGVFEMLTEDLPMPLVPGFSDVVCAADRAGGLYLGNQGSTWLYDPVDGFSEIKPATGCIEPGIKAVLCDREGNVWLGGRRGISKIVSRRFAGYDGTHGIVSDEVTAILQLRSGTIVLGHAHGLTFMDEDRNVSDRVEFAGNRPNERVLALAEDLEGNLWFAAMASGLGKRSPTGELRWYGSEAGITGDLNAVLADSSGQLWMLDADHLNRWDGERLVRVHSREGQGSYGRILSEAPDGSIRVGTSRKGVLVFQDGVQVPPANASDQEALGDYRNVFAIHDDPAGVTWVGTGAGLCRLEADGSLVPAVAPGPVIDRPVYFLLSDKEGWLWAGTNDGVYRWDGTQLEHFTVEDGLMGRETNRAARLVDRRGDVWLGTEGGVSVYRHRLDRPSTILAEVKVAGLEAGGVNYDLTRPVKVARGRDTLLFRFRAPSFVDEERMEFRTWLEGFEEGWGSPQASPTQEMRYTSLPSGTYRFHIRARGPGQPWGPVSSSNTIEIPGPLWAHPWVMGLAGAMAVLLVSAVISFANQRRTNRRLEREVERRVAETSRLQTEVWKAQKLEALGVLAGGIAHDFNNLLTVLFGSLSLIAEDEKAAPGTRALSKDALSAAERARGLTQQLLTFSRGGAPVLRTGSIADVVRESAAFVLHGSSVECAFELPADLMMVELDEDQISQVVGNLLLNAVQASTEGGRVIIRARNTSWTTRQGEVCLGIEIEFEDHGCGIEPADLPRVFDPYYSTKEGGTGLGLATAYSIVRRHGGSLVVESTPAKGSTFRIRLPGSDRKEAATSEEVVNIGSGGPKHVLLMDDDDSVRITITSMLQNLGHRVVAVPNGEEAVRCYADAAGLGDPFDAVFLDLTIRGGMGGRETVRHLLRIDPDVPAIVLSGYSNDPVLADHRAYGFQASVGKPATMEELAAALSAVDAPTKKPAAAGGHRGESVVPSF